MLLLFLACLPTALDPVDVPLAPDIPEPAREEERSLPTRDMFTVRGPQPTSLAYGLRGQPPGDVTVDGARVTVAGVRWEIARVEGVKAAWKLPSALQPELVPTNVEVNGAPCPLLPQLVPGSCALLDNTLVWAPAKAGQPKSVSFDVPVEAAQREAEIRGAKTFVSGLSTASYLVSGYEEPVFSTHRVGGQVTIQSLPPRSNLSFRPVLLRSPIFVGDGGPITFEVSVRTRDSAGPTLLHRVEVTDDRHALVKIPVPPEVLPPWSVLHFYTTRTPTGRLGPIPVFADAAIGG